MLLDMLPNVNEVHQRLKSLITTVARPSHVYQIITYLIQYCELCKGAYQNFLQKGEVDIDRLAEMASQGIPTAVESVSPAGDSEFIDRLEPVNPAKKTQPPVARRKAVGPPAAAPTAVVDDLITFSDDPPAGPVVPGQPQTVATATPETVRPPDAFQRPAPSREKDKQQTKVSLEGFEFDDDQEGDVAPEKFAAFLDGIGKKRKHRK
jgi:hypothetical protein